MRAPLTILGAVLLVALAVAAPGPGAASGPARRMKTAGRSRLDGGARAGAEAIVRPLGPQQPPPTVSVVIPTYNRGHIVAEAVESAIAQTYRNVEVIVADDGSADDTEARVRRIADPRVRYVRRPHAGVAAARNTGIAAATGQLISLLDSDDLWKPDKLEHEVGFLARHPEVHAVFSDLEKVDGPVHVPSFMRTTGVFARRLAAAPSAEDLVLSRAEMFRCLLEEVPIKTAALTMRREAIERAGLFDESWSSAEDWEFLLRFARTQRFGYIDRPLAVIRISPDSLHRLDREWSYRAMLGLLWREKRRARESLTRAAAGRGIASLTKHLSWYYMNAGRRSAAGAAYLRGFVRTGDASLLVRAAAAALAPRGVSWAWARRAGRLARQPWRGPSAA